MNVPNWGRFLGPLSSAPAGSMTEFALAAHAGYNRYLNAEKKQCSNFSSNAKHNG